MTAAATRPRRDNAGPAATGATQKSLGAYFKPAAALNQAVSKKGAAPKGKGRAPVGQPTLGAAATQQRFARTPGQAADDHDGMPRPLIL